MPTVTVSRHFNASPEQLYAAWLDPASARQWLFATPDGEMVTAEIDARVGGGFNLTERREDAEAQHLGRYIELDPPRRIVFDFKVAPYTDEETRVSIDIAPADGGSELTLTHDGVWEDWEERTRQGWTMILDNLASVLGE